MECVRPILYFVFHTIACEQDVLYSTPFLFEKILCLFYVYGFYGDIYRNLAQFHGILLGFFRFFYSFHNLFGFPTFLAWASLKLDFKLVEMRIWCIKIGIALVLHVYIFTGMRYHPRGVWQLICVFFALCGV
jgi:hypothetical protein